MSCILKLSSITKSFGQHVIIDNINLEVKSGEVIALIGKSGSGKTTVLQIAGLLDEPTSGSIWVNGTDCTKINDRQKTYLRGTLFGFIYQFHHLLHEFSALENVMLPQMILGKNKGEAKKNAQSMLANFGLQDSEFHMISELSGGERQRLAIARGLINFPQLVLADEPTGNLDPENSLKVFSLLHEYAKVKNIAVLIVTHNHTLAQKADMIFVLEKGVLTKLQ
ncbi:ABC transporter ATP-binding protein [Candidatus Mesenet endosymbiont of Agriotes lineatus]|uniref:ABC transporter ATP-binding protein n=1 Tax=Candidatus Mesenet endosymbiont of Agriotes lineatus TaxID=3077948 RepID=UPI0030D4C1BB